MKSYKKPVLNVERFTANEFVAACGDSGVTYLFTCDAGGGESGRVYVESNGVDGLQTRGEWVGGWGGHWQSADDSLGRYHACGTTHEAKSTDDFLNGYYVPYGASRPTDVIIWTDNGTDVHCTTNLDQDSWETAKS